MKKLKNKKVLLIAIPVLVLLVGLAVGGSVILMNEDKNKSKNEVKEESPKELTEDVINATELKLKENYEVEVGANLEEIDWLEFVENKDELTEDDKHKFNGLSFEAVDTSKAGEYEYVLKYDNKLHTGKIIVKEKEEEKKEEAKEDKKETASSSSNKNNTSTSKPSTNTSTTKPSNNTSSSSSNNSSSSSNNTAPAPTPTPEPKPAVTCPPVRTKTNDGFTLTSDGNCGGTVSYAGHSAGVKWTCDTHGCSAYLTNGGGSNSNIMVVGGSTSKNVGSYAWPNTTYNTPESMSLPYGALFDSKQAFESHYGISISKLSYQVKDTTNVYEADNVYGGMASFINQILDEGKTFVKYNTMDYNFRINGFILLIGTPLNNNQAGPAAYSWEQHFVN